MNKFTLSKAEARLLAEAEATRRARMMQAVEAFNAAVGDILESHGVARDQRGSFYASPDGVIVWNAVDEPIQENVSKPRKRTPPKPELVQEPAS